MEKYFANYNQSLALKELGFDEPCFGTWKKDVDGNNPTKYTIDFHTKVQLDYDLCPKNSDYTNDWVSAPLKSQVFEWMRDKHLLSYHIDDFTMDGKVRYDYCIRELGSQDDDLYGVYEEYSDAESACIDKLIEIVKNK